MMWFGFFHMTVDRCPLFVGPYVKGQPVLILFALFFYFKRKKYFFSYVEGQPVLFFFPLFFVLGEKYFFCFVHLPANLWSGIMCSSLLFFESLDT